RHRSLAGRHGEIDQKCGSPFSPQDFIESNNPALTWNQFVTGLLTQFFENWIERRILKLLRDDCALQIEKTTGLSEPFEIAVVIAGDHYTAFPPGVSRGFLQILPLDVAREILRRQTWAP